MYANMIMTVVSPTNTAHIINSKRRKGDLEKKLFLKLKVERWSFVEELILPNFYTPFHHPDPKLNL